MAAIRFIRTMLRMPLPWLVWLALLTCANAVVPLFFLSTVEAKVVLATVAVAAALEVFIFSTRGFVRLLGIGHFVWFPMLAWLWGRFDAVGFQNPLGMWLFWLITINGISLIIDVVDVVRYLRGERDPVLSLEDR